MATTTERIKELEAQVVTLEARLSAAQGALKALDEETETDCKPHSQDTGNGFVYTPFGRAKELAKHALATLPPTTPRERQCRHCPNLVSQCTCSVYTNRED